MKAYILAAPNDLTYQDVDMPLCRPGWVLVQVKAAGICSSDIPRIFVKGTYHFPTIPGHEFSGIVVQAIDDADGTWVGKRVGVFPLIPCQSCEQCVQEHYEMCSQYNYLGSRCDGGFAEYVAVPVWNLIELPDKVTFEEAAMMEPLAVALHAVKQADVRSGDVVAIVGSGMIGFAAAQWAVRFGAAQVCVIGRSESKREQVQMLSGIQYHIGQPQQEFDVVIEAVGSASSICCAVELTKPLGRLVLMGNPEGDITLPQDTYWRILRRQLRVSGTWNSEYRCGGCSDWSQVRDALVYDEILVKPLISHCFPQDRLKEGLNLMAEHKEPFCKVMTIWNVRG